MVAVTASNVLLDKAYEEYDNEFIYCCCITATISRVFSSVDVFIVMWKRTPFTAG